MDIAGHIGAKRDWAKIDEGKLATYTWKCKQLLIAMQYQLTLVEKELAGLEAQEKEQIAVVNRWDEISDRIKESGPISSQTINNIYRRCFSKLAKCDIGIRLEKQLQIKIFLARIDVLRQFMADNHLA